MKLYRYKVRVSVISYMFVSIEIYFIPNVCIYIYVGFKFFKQLNIICKLVDIQICGFDDELQNLQKYELNENKWFYSLTTISTF